MFSADLFPVEPHPELVAVQRPGARDIAVMASVLGWLPEPEERLRPAVPAGGGGVDLETAVQPLTCWFLP